MFGNRRLPAAFLAGGLAALAVLAGCVREPGVASRNAAALPEARSEHLQDHGEGMAPDAAASVPPGKPAATLRPDALDAPAPTSVIDAQRSEEMAAEMSGGGHAGHGGHGGHEGHGAGTYVHADVGRGPEAHEGSEDHTPGAEPHRHGPATPPSGHEGHSHHEPPVGAAQDTATVYVCPMHPEVTSTAPGKCPKCGMALVERRKP